MNQTNWQSGRPPNGEFVEVQDRHGRIIKVKVTIRDGVVTGWQSADAISSYSANFFSVWRRLVQQWPPAWLGW